MGYEISIIRDSEKLLNLQEWMDYIDRDSELDNIDTITGINPSTGDEIKVSLQNAAIYKLEEAVFNFSEENNSISVKNPSQKTIDKMVEIAHSLAAVVEGEEGERYNILTPQIDNEYQFQQIKKTKKWFEFWKLK